ncbi:MAG TPA: hypothetical protein VJL31_16790 [Gemmatimonadales bacterium]|nr:hypothetical protein [Gemmatimonadales bacterium]
MDRTTLLGALAGIHSERGAGRLFALLGYLPDDHADDDNARVVARWRGFQVVATIMALAKSSAGCLA